MNESEEQINRFEEAIRKLKIQYDIFFAGVRKLPPTEDKKRLDEMMRDLSGKSRIRDNAMRFRLSTLISRYNQFQELWGRQMREREEGPTDYRRRVAALAGNNGAEKKEATPPPRPAPVTSGAPDPYVRVTRSEEGEALKTLHAQILEANQRLGKSSALSLEQVAAMVQKQAQDLRDRFKVETIAFRVETVEGKVKLKARPVQER
ncbi:MAG TPA: MXAN_5187 C-terminal domain-containing protein [Thermoanaerobaculia bacterium]|nr:MXAN_5187 C-terminal domain-containing protein [Thermoanaerobaculia bacterium]